MDGVGTVLFLAINFRFDCPADMYFLLPLLLPDLSLTLVLPQCPTCTHRPEADRPHGVPPGHPLPHHFVTALQWRRNSPHLLAANSAGNVWLLGLQL
jgi:hypothetical protein